MTYLFYFGHPAQYLFCRATIIELSRSNEHKIIITIKTKDVLEDLVKADHLPYINIQSKKRGGSKPAIILNMLKRNMAIFRLALKYKPSLMIGTDATIAQIGFLLNIPRITIVEDDYAVIKTLAKLTYPFTKHILCPSICDVGKWKKKKIAYNGYMKLGYLHPKVFSPNKAIVETYKLDETYAIVRLAKLTAHHDFGIKGISSQTLSRIIDKLKEKNIKVYISSEKQLDPAFSSYELKIDPSDMHHILSYSTLLICDSQSMSLEAAVLGVPSIRISDFAGKISVLEELEKKYRLTFGIKPEDDQHIFNTLDTLIQNTQIKNEFQSRRGKMLSDKICVTDFLLWFIQNYPRSLDTLKENSNYQDRFNFHLLPN
jgi:predicted glycosyltransferase